MAAHTELSDDALLDAVEKAFEGWVYRCVVLMDWWPASAFTMSGFPISSAMRVMA